MTGHRSDGEELTLGVDPCDLRAAFGRFATGVTVVTARSGRAPLGMTANAFTSVSLAPPMLLVCLSNSARCLGAIEKGGVFGVSVLSEDQQDCSAHFAGTPRLEEVAFHDLDGVPMIRGATAQFACDLEAVHAAGDHRIVVGRVRAYAHGEARPLLFHNGTYKGLA
ncbi:flavin reductase family protein [Alloyangia mangrovi]|nr:flavin reductase family protein [Alloyangia mangrovi]